MLPSRSRTLSFVWRMERRILESSGDAPSNISSSPSMHRSISSSTERWVEMYPARLLRSGTFSSFSMASLARRETRRQRDMPISSAGDTNSAACMRFRHSRISGKLSIGERPVRIITVSASAVNASADFTLSNVS